MPGHRPTIHAERASAPWHPKIRETVRRIGTMLWAVLAALVLALAGCKTTVRHTVLILGDSNIANSTGAINRELVDVRTDQRGASYLPIINAIPGYGACPAEQQNPDGVTGPTGCPASTPSSATSTPTSPSCTSAPTT